MTFTLNTASQVIRTSIVVWMALSCDPRSASAPAHRLPPPQPERCVEATVPVDASVCR
jgi:hypothetical protein